MANDKEDLEVEPTKRKPALLCSTRLNLALIAFLGCVIIYALRSNLSFAIVCMVKQAPAAPDGQPLSASQTGVTKLTVPVGEKCPRNSSFFSSSEAGQEESPLTGEFDWSKNMQGTLLSAFFWGYLTSQVLGGYLASRIGAKRVVFAAVFLSSLISLVSPPAARVDAWVFFALRVVLGFAQGSIFPAMHTMWAVWAPPLERSILTGVSYAGAQIGNVLVMPLSGFLCRYGFQGGWPSIFYTLGVAGLAWCALWWCLAADNPLKHRRITDTERVYIVESLGGKVSEVEILTGEKSRKKRGKRPVPIAAIMTSPAVWAIFVGHFAGDWGAYTMATSLPSFLNDVLGLKLTSMGVVSALPYIVYFLMINVGGVVSDRLRHAGMLSTVNTRRLAMLVALGGQAAFLVAIGYCRCGQELLVIALLTLSVGISGLQYAGFVVNYLDICPAHAGTMLGIGNTLSCLAGVLSPLCMGWLTPTGSKEEWRLVFFLTASILVFGAVFFAVFAKGEVQAWAHDDWCEVDREGLANGNGEEQVELTPLGHGGKKKEGASNGTKTTVGGAHEPLLDPDKEAPRGTAV